MRHCCLVFLIITGAFLLAACIKDQPNPAAEPTLAPVPQPRQPALPLEQVLDGSRSHPAWHAELLAAVADYHTYTKVADYPQWAPTLCTAPAREAAFASKARGDEAHGRKLYFLWVRDGKAYGADKVGKASPDEMPQPVGQVIVKESYHPVEAKAGVKRGDRYYQLGDKGPLFVMLKLREDEPGTDRGWIYGTLTPDGTKVTSAGLLESCIGCHEDAGDDRVFGVRASLHLNE